MNNELNETVMQTELEKIEKIKESINKIVNKKSKFIYCIPESQNPAASVYELYFHATIVKNMGYDVIILVENNNDNNIKIPDWIEKELTNHKHMSLSSSKLQIGPEDVMIIPDVFSNVMEQTKNLPCLRIGFLQSVDYMLNALIPGVDWSTFGIKDIITTSQTLKEWMELFYGKNKFNIITYNIGIPDYFEKSKMPQKPIISIVGRNPNEISKFVKLFYSKYPEYNWVTFDPMLTHSKPPQTMRRVDFANRLKENFAAVWIDRISSFGTFPLECMKSGVIPVCLKPDIIPEYIIERDENNNPVKLIENAGIWVDSYYDLPIIVGELLVRFLDDSINPIYYETMDKIASKYSQESSENMIIDVYKTIINNRIESLNKIINLLYDKK